MTLEQSLTETGLEMLFWQQDHLEHHEQCAASAAQIAAACHHQDSCYQTAMEFSKLAKYEQEVYNNLFAMVFPNLARRR